MIVKVQVSISSNLPFNSVLIYDKERDVMYQGKLPDDVKAAMRGRPKAFFNADLKEVRPDEFEVILGDEAPWQNW